MAEEQIVAEFDDRALFDSAVASTPPEANPAPPDLPADAGAAPASASPAPPPPPAPPLTQPRDELGRFTPAPRQQEGTQPPAPAPHEEVVPSWRLREEREQREAYAARLAERERQLGEVVGYIQRMQQAQQPPPQIPDPLLNPGEWQAHQQQSMQQLYGAIAHQIRTNQLESNLQLTRLERGPELFDEAYQAFMASAQGDVGFARSIVGSPNPGAAMCEWYQRAKALDTYGADPEAYFNSRINSLLQDHGFLAKAIDAARGIANGGRAPPSNNVTVLPPSLTSMRSGSSPESGVITNAAGEDLMSDQMLFQAALAPGQQRR